MIIERFIQQVEKQPAKIAVKTESGSLTYNELNVFSQRIAGGIKALQSNSQNPGATRNIGLLFDSGLDMIAAILGVLKSGSAYVPLVKDYPPKRIEYIAAHAEIDVFITDKNNLGMAAKAVNNKNIRFITVEEIADAPVSMQFNPAADGDRSAYLLYTSGSTGRPKGVVQTQRNILYFIDRYIENLNLSSADRITHFPVFTHDASVVDLYSALLSGASLFPLDLKKGDRFGALAQWLAQEEITVFHSVPTVFRYFIAGLREAPHLPRLRYIVLGGEAVFKSDVERFSSLFPQACLYNLYGQTESTYNSGQFFYPGQPVGDITLGQVNKGTQFFVINEAGSEVELLEVGEIVVAGAHISPGYFKAEEETTAKFIEDEENGRLYFTGDLGRLLCDGRIEYVERKDNQVKVRGFRVELGEIENVVLSYPDITAAAAVPITTEAWEIFIACYFSAVKKIELDELRDFLGQNLVDYMIPSYFKQLQKLPLTVSNKVDRKALPPPEVTIGEEYRAPVTEIEKKLAEIWSGILEIGKEVIGLDSNFFALGGHSLRATLLVSRIHNELQVKIPLQEIFKTPTIRGISRFIAQAHTSIYETIHAVEKREYYPQSPAQKRLFFLDKFENIGVSYNMPAVFRMQGEYDHGRFSKVFRCLIERHDSLRTSFHEIDENLVQRIHQSQEIAFAIEYHEDYHLQRPDMSSDSSAAGTEMQGQIIEDFIKPFDLSLPPLLHVAVIRLADNENIFLFDMHHIIADGTSMGRLIDDFILFYDDQTPVSLKIQYADFSTWQNNLLQTGCIKDQEDYWRSRFPDPQEIPILALPTDYTRPSEFDFRGARTSCQLYPPLVRDFNSIGRRHGATLYMNLMAAFNVLLYKYSAQQDIVVGTGIMGRPHVDLLPIIGMFVNTLALRNQPQPHLIYAEFLNLVKENALAAFENQDLQFEDLVDKVCARRDASRNPLFDVCLVVQNFERARRTMKDLVFVPYNFQFAISKFDITLYAYEVEDTIYLQLEYCTSLFKAETIERLSGHLVNIIRQLGEDPGLTLAAIDILSDEEKERLLFDFNASSQPYDLDNTIHEIIMQQAGRFPDRPAVVGPGQFFLTYRELVERSDRIAAYLLQGENIGPDEPVGVMLDRSLDFVIAVFGILKAGAAYVPLDPVLPEERLKALARDACIGVVISQKKEIRRINRLQWECPAFHSFLLMDSAAVYEEEEVEKSELMDERLWQHVAQTAEDEITAGGWRSSYTGEPLSGQEMAEYGDNALKKLALLLNPDMKVLEIGCASGITMYRIAPKVALYYGTDLSKDIIEKNKERCRAEDRQNIRLTCLPAHRIDEIDEQDFDLVILNSVVQCFPGHNHFRKVLRKIIGLTAKSGFIFFGDIMDQDLKQALIDDLVEFKSKSPKANYKTKTDFSQELFLSRDFFRDLAVEIPGICDVRFSGKIHTLENELTRFRYDCLLRIEKSASASGKAVMQPKHKYQHDLAVLDRYGRERVENPARANNLAYILFTSGTSGRPKGVLIEHSALVNLCAWHNRYFGVSLRDRNAQYSAISFDASVFEIFPFLAGAVPLHFIPEEIKLDIQQVNDYLERNNVTICCLPTQFCEQFMECKNQSLRVLLTGGDKLRVYVPGKYRFYNNYGPTENTVATTSCPVDEYRDNIPIGKPIDNHRVYILGGENFQLQAIGVPGELCIGGVGLSRGYLNNPELTAEKFVSGGQGAFLKNRPLHPQKTFEKSYVGYLSPLTTHHLPFTTHLYKTGDLARWLCSGDIEFLGRIDQQVKVRGFRIELGEIENRLLKHEKIREAAVIDKQDANGEKYLCAYLVGLDISTAEIKEYLKTSLPDYMIPQHFVLLDKIPYTPNGKLDRRALPAPQVAVEEDYTAPRNEIEKKLAAIWAETLAVDVEKISIDGNFFELGGHSLKATVMTTKIYKELGVKVPIAEVFKNSSIRGLSELIAKSTGEKFKRIEAVEKREYYELSFNQRRLWIIQQRNRGDNSYNMSSRIVMDQKVDEAVMRQTIAAIMTRHESLRIGFREIAGRAVQYVVEKYELPFSVVDLSSLPAEQLEKKLQRTLSEFELKPFNLEQPPLFRALLIKTADERWIFSFNMHHIITDGWSMGILERDFRNIYNAHLNGGAGVEDLHPITYKDFAARHNKQLADAQVRKLSHEFWSAFLSRELPLLRLPGGRAGAGKTKQGASYRFVIPQAVKEALKTQGGKHNITLFSFLYSVYIVFLAQLSAQRVVVASIVNAGRDHAALLDIVGFFVNAVPFRKEVDFETVFIDFAGKVQAEVLDFFKHQNYPLELVLEEKGRKYPDIAASFNMVNVLSNENLALENMDSYHTAGKQNVKFEIELYVSEYSNGVEINAAYNRELSKADDVAFMMEKYSKLVEFFALHPFNRLKDYKEEKKKKVVVKTNMTAVRR